MIVVRYTKLFQKWFLKLRDRQARFVIEARLDRVRSGNLGDVKAVGDGVSEMRIHYGAGYRIYFVQYHSVLVVLLCAGNKQTQEKDIKTAKDMAAQLEDLEQWLVK